jgi:formate dehydrogenase subunit gamma
MLAAFLAASPVVLYAQNAQNPPNPPPAPTSGFNPTANSVSEQELLKELDRVTGRVSIPDRKSGTLIQPQGREWRFYRRSILPWIGGVVLLGTLAALAVFYLWRGSIRIESGRSGRTIVRFGWFERFVHWLTAVSWLVLAITGLNVAFGRQLLLPLMGEDAFSTMTEWGKYAHNFLAFPFTLGIILIFLSWVRYNLPNRIDIDWLRQAGGMLWHAHPPAEKFNAGQKAVFWIVVLAGGLVAASGYVLLFPFWFTDIAGQQTAHVAHSLLAVLMIAAILGHIYIGTLGMEGAFEAMGSGDVDLNWAKEHHSLWVEEELAKTPKGSAAAPAAE